MDAALLLPLAGLALVDSTSLGTLLMPVWMLVQPRVRVSRYLTYLATIAIFYALLGVVLVLGAAELRALVAELGRVEWVRWVQLALGAMLLAASFRVGNGPDAPSPRASAWQARLVGEDATLGTAALLGLLAAGAEVASMLPYLGAVALITAAALPTAQWVGVLVAYAVVMIMPALLLLVGRVAADGVVRPRLERLGGWLTRHAGASVGWLLGIAGFLLAQDAAGALGLLGGGVGA